MHVDDIIQQSPYCVYNWIFQTRWTTTPIAATVTSRIADCSTPFQARGSTTMDPLMQRYLQASHFSHIIELVEYSYVLTSPTLSRYWLRQILGPSRIPCLTSTNTSSGIIAPTPHMILPDTWREWRSKKRPKSMDLHRMPVCLSVCIYIIFPRGRYKVWRV